MNKFSVIVPEPNLNVAGSGILSWNIIRYLNDQNLLETIFIYSFGEPENEESNTFIQSINKKTFRLRYGQDFKTHKFFSKFSGTDFYYFSDETIELLKSRKNLRIFSMISANFSFLQGERIQLIQDSKFEQRVYQFKVSRKFNFRNFMRIGTSFLFEIGLIYFWNRYKQTNLITFSTRSAKFYKRLGGKVKKIDWFVERKQKNFLRYTDNSSRRSYYRFLILGNSQSTAGKNINLGLNKIIKLFEKSNIEYEILFVGNNQLPEIDEISSKLKYFGYVKELSEILCNVDFLIYPSEYPVGVRTRILTSLSYGIPVITHRNGINGLEKLDSSNSGVLIYNDTDTFTEVIETLQNQDFETLRKNAFRSWEKYYNSEINISKIFEDSL